MRVMGIKFVNSVTIEKVVRETLEPFPSITVGFLFGSTAKGTTSPLSDVDVAVLLDPSAPVETVEGTLNDALCRALGTDHVDLVMLADAPSSLAYRIIRDGRCILCRDAKAKENFESKTIMRYLDFKPVRERAFETARRRALEAV